MYQGMLIYLIVAMDSDHGIGWQGGVSWHLPSDMKRFKALTMGHWMIMGRKTYQSIGKPLPGRTNVIISRNVEFTAHGCLVSSSFDSALRLAAEAGEEEIFIIGGAEIYQLAMPFADRIYLTEVHAIQPSDTWFPAIDESLWHEIHRQDFREPSDEFSYTFRILHHENEA